MTTVLVLSGGGFQGLALIKPLRRLPGVRVIVADCNDEHVARFAAHGSYRAPPLADAVAFEAFLLGLCQRESVRHIFPATSFELRTLLRLRPALARIGAAAWVSSAEVLALGSDKGCFYNWLAVQGLPVLPALPRPDPACHPGAWIGKPAAGWGGTGIVKAASAEAARRLADERGDGWIWQPLLDGFEEFSIDFAIDALGRTSPLFARRRVRVFGGFAVIGEPSTDAAVLDAASRTAAALADAGAQGVLNLQVLVDSEGRAWVSDLNPRVGTSMPLTTAQGGGDPVTWLLCGHGTGTGASPGSRPGVRTIRLVRQLEERCHYRPDLRGIRGVVFDLDDTLIDQKAWIIAKLELMWAATSTVLPLPARKQFLAEMLQIIEEGERARSFDVYAERLGVATDARDLMIQSYRAALPNCCETYPDAVGVLRQLRSRGLRLAVLTDNPASSQRAKLDRSPLPPLVDAVVLTDDLGCKKPDSRAFVAAAAALDVPPESLVMVGDNIARDIGGALAAGWRHAFHVQRHGAFFNHAIAAWRTLLSDNWTSLGDLVELDWYLEESFA